MNGTDLAELLASATIRSTPPSVSELHRRWRQAQRRKTIVAVTTACFAVAVGAAAIVVAVDDRRSFEVTTVDSTTVPASTVSPAATEAPPPVVAAEERDGGPAILMPPEGWQLAGLQGGGYTVPAPGVLAVTGPAGPLGPMVWIRFNAGVGTLDYPDGPTTHHDTTSPAGHTVRVGWSADPQDLIAIRLVEGGSVAITSFDLGEAELLTLIDAATVTGDGVIQIDTAALPAGFTIGPTAPDRPYLTSNYTLQGPNRAVLVSVSRWAGAGSDALAFIRYRSTTVETTINGHPALIASPDATTDNYATALLVDTDSWDAPGWAYTFTIPPDTDTGPGVTAAEIEALLTSLRAIGPDELIAQVPGLRDRQTSIDRWLADVPVPATADLSVLREGPPMGGSEAEWIYQVLTCSVVLDWAVTGNNERLDQLASSASWAVAVDLHGYREDLYDKLAAQGAGALPMYDQLVTPADLDQAREAATADERWATTLVEDCQWAMALTGQRRS